MSLDELSTEALDDLLDELGERISHIGEMFGWEAEYYTIDSNSIELYWTENHCSCCGTEHHYESFPSSYLTMPDEDIMKTEEGKKVEAARLEAEREKAEAIRTAERRVAEALKKTQTAEAEAKQRLARAQADLARMRDSA
tara:strand:- start:1061 stop:1480 length:420 start_codon:yes stop_codon:yes gene_type:complete